MSLVVGLLVVVAAVHPRHERGYENPQITTVQDGKVWLFGVIEHWNAEALGWHVAKRCDHYAAVQAVGRYARTWVTRRLGGALFGVSVTSTPFRNVTPATTLGNWFLPSAGARSSPQP